MTKQQVALRIALIVAVAVTFVTAPEATASAESVVCQGTGTGCTIIHGDVSFTMKKVGEAAN
jgi:hypothetical protein